MTLITATVRGDVALPDLDLGHFNFTECKTGMRVEAVFAPTWWQ